MDNPRTGLASLGRREKTLSELADADPEVIARRTATMPVLGEGKRFRFERGAELVGREAWALKQSGIVACIRMEERDHEGAHVRGAKIDKFHVGEIGLLQEGDLVAVFHGGEPSWGNQHLRRVDRLTSMTAPDGTPFDRVVLGPALGLDALSGPSKRGTILTTLCIDRKDEKLSVRDGAGNVLSTYTAPTWYEADHLESKIKSLIEAGARHGRRDRRDGHENGVRQFLDIESAGDGKGRRWELVDKEGRVFESAPRSIMDRRPPAHLRELFHVGTTAYEEAYGVNIAPRPGRVEMGRAKPIEISTSRIAPVEDEHEFSAPTM